MMTTATLSPANLRRAADIMERIEQLRSELEQIVGGSAPVTTKLRKKRRRLSPQAIANIRAGVRKRWADRHAAASNGKPRRTMPAAAKARLARIARKRWRLARAAGRSTL